MSADIDRIEELERIVADLVAALRDAHPDLYNQLLPIASRLPLPAPPLPGESNARFIAGPATPSKR
jgi:hypothetical protein